MSKNTQEIATTKDLLLASLLGDNPGRAFNYAELSRFLKAITREAIYEHVKRLRKAGMDIKARKGTVTYKGL